MKKSIRNTMINIFFNLFLILSFTNFVFAGGDVTVPDDVRKTLVEITKILLLIGSAVCVGKIIHIGILYLTATAVEKSHAKEALFPWILGTIICFGAATIGGAVIKIFTQGSVLPSDVLSY